MGRYSEYFDDIWKLKTSRKTLGLSLFGTILDNSAPFTPGNQLSILPGVDTALSMLAQKGYNFLIITGQPGSRTKNLDQQDFENILNSVRELIMNLGGELKYSYFTPSTDKNDLYVKPNTGMWDRAQKEGNIRWEDSIFVGSDMNDVKASTKVKAKPVLIKSKNNQKSKSFELSNQVKIEEYENLLEFANSL